MIAPPNSFWRHSVTLRRKSWSPDLSLGMTASNADAGVTLKATVQERSQDTRPVRTETNEAILAHRLFDVLIPVIDPATGLAQFSSAIAIKTDDRILWGSRTLRVLIDVDEAGRGGFGQILTAYCEEIV